MELFSLLAKLTLDSKEYDKDLDEAQRKAESIGDIEPSLELDNKDFNDNIAESQGLGDTFGTEMEGVFKGIKNALTVTGIVGAIAGIVNGLKEAVNMTAETADGIDKGSRRLGISTKAYQEWDHALRQSGSGIGDITKGIMVMQQAIVAADPKTMFADAEDAVDGLADKTAGLSEDAKKAFDSLGLAGKLANHEFGSAEELMEATLTALAGYQGSTEERGILVRALFGKGGDQLNALLDSGEQGVKDLLAEAGNLGLIMSEDEINNAVAYGDSVANLNEELNAIKMAFVQDIIPVLKDASDWLTSVLQAFNPRLRENSLAQTFEQIDQKTLSTVADLETKANKAQAIIDKLAEMGDYWTLDDNGKKTFDALADELIKLYPELDKVINNNKDAISKNKDEILKNIDAWTLLEKQRLLDQNLADKKTAVAEKYAKALDKEIEAELKEADAAAERQNAIDQVNEALGKNEELRSAVQGAFGVTELNEGNADSILSFIRDNGFQTSNMTALDSFVELNTEASKLRTEAQSMTEEADAAQESLTDYATKLAEKMGVSTESVIKAKEQIGGMREAINSVPTDHYTTFHFVRDEEAFRPHAIGLDNVPYDNYPALLHRGERVLTATQARKENSGGDLSGLEDRISGAIRDGMKGVTVNSYLNGRRMNDEMNRESMREIKARRFKG